MSFPIPDSRLTSWVPGVDVGIIGGIPVRTNIVNVTGLVFDDPDAEAANTAIINGFIAGASDGDVILLPSGTFWGGFSFTPSQSNRTVRGAGMDVTIIKVSTNVAAFAGSSSDYDHNFPTSDNIDSSGTHIRGDDTITITDTSDFYSGAMALLNIQNNRDDAGIEDGSIPFVYEVRPINEFTRRQMIRVESKTSSTITFNPPLLFNAPGSDIKITLFRQRCVGVGIEDITFDCEDATTQWGVWFDQCYGCWMKNLRVMRVYNYAIFLSNSLHCEVRGCFMDRRKSGGSNGSALLSNLVGNSLIEDNILYRNNPLIEVNEGCTGNAVLYNLFEDPRPNAGIDSNHNPHNSYNLYEGNITPNVQCDGYYGSTSEDTVYRNWITGFAAGDFVFIVSLNRFTRYYGVVGNIIGTSGWPYGDNPYSMGNPNIGNGSYVGTAQPSDGDFWGDWKGTGTLTERVDDTHGTITLDPPCTIGPFYVGVFFREFGSGPSGNLVMEYLSIVIDGNDVSFTTFGGGILPPLDSFLEVYPGENGFQELDLDVATTTILKANYHQFGSGGPGIPAGQELGGDTLFDSLAYSETPDWWPGDLAWPPFDPLDPGSPSYDNIPAGARWLEMTPPSAPEIISPCTVSGSPVDGQLLTAIPGAVTGNPTPDTTWRWERDGTPIIGATSITYLLTDDDVGHDVGPVQIETNTEGFDESVATPLTILAFTGDQLVVTQVANASPVTELWLRGALTDGVSAPLAYYLVHHSGDYPTQPENNFVYARFGTPQDNVYVFDGTISQAEAIASVP